MADPAPYDFTASRDKIRDAGKWLIGASAAIGAALIAGSQLSGIGSLRLCAVSTPWSWSVPCLRLPIALIGAGLALGAVAAMIWRSVRLLVPVAITLDDLATAWQEQPRRPDVAFLLANPDLRSASTPAELAAKRQELTSYLNDNAPMSATNAASLLDAERQLEALTTLAEGRGPVDAAELAAGAGSDPELLALLEETTGEVRRQQESVAAARSGVATAEQAYARLGSTAPHRCQQRRLERAAAEVVTSHRAMTDARTELGRARTVAAGALAGAIAEVTATVARRRRRQTEIERKLAEAETSRATWMTTAARVVEIAQYQVLLHRFRRLTRILVLWATLAAIGITAYAWASNPAPAGGPDLAGAELVDADLGGADLTGATLDRADLTGADLTGATLDGASLRDVTWSNTTCPDGSNSDRNDAAAPTCLGHLSP